MKTVLFVPGYQENLTSRDYSATITAIESSGYKVVFVPIAWQRTTIEHWVKELQTVYAEYDPAQTILAGFSFGAMTAFTAAVRRNPSELWLFSLSSYFTEDIVSKNQKKSWLTSLGHRRVDAFKALNFKQLADRVTCRTLLFYGQKELDQWPIMNERAQGAHAYLKTNKLIIVDGAGHDVADKLYVEAIATAI